MQSNCDETQDAQRLVGIDQRKGSLPPVSRRLGIRCLSSNLRKIQVILILRQSQVDKPVNIRTRWRCAGESLPSFIVCNLSSCINSSIPGSISDCRSINDGHVRAKPLASFPWERRSPLGDRSVELCMRKEARTILHAMDLCTACHDCEGITPPAEIASVGICLSVLPFSP